MMAGQHSAMLAAGTLAPGCRCENPLCLAEDEGRCCRCGRLYVPATGASTRRLALKLARIARAS